MAEPEAGEPDADDAPLVVVEVEDDDDEAEALLFADGDGLCARVIAAGSVAIKAIARIEGIRFIR